MIYPATTALFAAIFALVYVGLAGWVVAGRLGTETLHGDVGHPDLLKRIRSHGNFAEYVPFALILIGLLEASGSSHGLVTTLLVILLVARLLHPVGMLAPTNSPQQFACRGGGTISTFLVLIVAAVTLLIHSA